MNKKKAWGRWLRTEAESFAEGGQGKLYRVKDGNEEHIGKHVLKQIKNPKRDWRFANEVRAISLLDKHPNVVSLVDSNMLTRQEEEKLFYVMAEADHSIEKHLLKNPEAVDRCLDLFLGILDGVQHIHTKNIVHRDIKPENILMFNGIPMVADLGLCLLCEFSRETPSHEAVGPRYYMAPEFEDGRQLDVTVQADIYSLGKVLYYMISGGKVFSREKHDLPDWNLALKLGDKRYEMFAPVFRKSMAESPKRRYTTANEFADDIRKLREKFAAHPGTSLRHKIAGVEQDPSAPINILVQLSAEEWCELLQLRDDKKTPFSADVISALELSLQPPLAGAAALEVYTHRAEISQSKKIEMARQIVLLNSYGANPYSFLAPYWSYIYELAVQSDDFAVIEIVAVNEAVTAAPSLLSALACRFEHLSDQGKGCVLVATISKDYEGREALLFALSEQKLSDDLSAMVTAGLLHGEQDANIARVVEMLRQCSDLVEATPHINGIALQGRAKTYNLLRDTKGINPSILEMLKVLADLSERAPGDQ